MINRRRVRSEGVRYSGYCHYCNAPLRRITRDRWVRDWRATFGMSPPPEVEAPPPPKPQTKRKRKS
jgi:hypothetical protein